MKVYISLSFSVLSTKKYLTEVDDKSTMTLPTWIILLHEYTVLSTLRREQVGYCKLKSESLQRSTFIHSGYSLFWRISQSHTAYIDVGLTRYSLKTFVLYMYNMYVPRV